MRLAGNERVSSSEQLSQTSLHWLTRDRCTYPSVVGRCWTARGADQIDGSTRKAERFRTKTNGVRHYCRAPLVVEGPASFDIEQNTVCRDSVTPCLALLDADATEAPS